jgi:ribosomal protein S18 acetylase RimI-like enzyme
MKVRRASNRDIPYIVRFNAAMAEETEKKVLDIHTLENGVKELFTSSKKGFYIVGEHEGTVVGCLLITKEWSDWRNRDFWWIQSVYVLPEHRNKGVYRSLHRFVEDMARSRRDVCGIRLYVDKSNASAQRAYRAMGMRLSNYDLFEKEF